MAVSAVVFDFDGLILDTEGPVYSAWVFVFERYGCGPLTIDEWALEIGTVGGLDLIGMMQARATKPFDEDEMHVLRRNRCAELLEHETIRPGVVEWLDAADELGLGLTIASSSTHEWVEPQLDRLGLRHRFAHVVCFGPDIAPKPAPDTYVTACAALGVEPRAALAVEDSPHGVRAAKTAGLQCVAVPHAITELLDLSHADLVLPSLADRPLGDVIQQLQRPPT